MLGHALKQLKSWTTTTLHMHYMFSTATTSTSREQCLKYYTVIRCIALSRSYSYSFLHPEYGLPATQITHCMVNKDLLWCVLLRQTGNTSRSILELEDEEVALRGYAEVHAALAAVLYAERPGQRLRAEQQWDVATEFDTRYNNVQWVATAKHWPPSMLKALQRFLELS